jgi:hypothetical protein
MILDRDSFAFCYFWYFKFKMSNLIIIDFPTSQVTFLKFEQDDVTKSDNLEHSALL